MKTQGRLWGAGGRVEVGPPNSRVNYNWFTSLSSDPDHGLLEYKTESSSC